MGHIPAEDEAMTKEPSCNFQIEPAVSRKEEAMTHYFRPLYLGSFVPGTS